MNIAYVIWIEHLNAPIIQGQVIEVLRKISKTTTKDKLYFFAFQSIYFILLHYQELRKMSKELRDDNIDLIIVPTITLPLFFATWHVIPLIFLQSFPTLLVLTHIKKIDILHCRSYPIMLAAIMVKKVKKKLKIIFDPRSPFPEENITANRWTERSFTYKLWKKLEKLYLNESDITIAITNTYIEHFAKISPSSRFVVIPNNVDTTKFIPNKEFREYLRSKIGISDDEIIFAYSGSLGNQWNNPKVYAKFVIKLRKINIKHRFLFITQQISELKRVFDRHGIGPNEYFTISADREDVPKYLSIADFGLNLMGKEDIRMSIKTVEYLAMGLPIIINSNVLGAKEIIKQREVGLILKDSKDINLEEMKIFMKKRDELALRCRNFACEKFSTVEIAKQYADIYKELKENIYEN
jgi:glycosyltransferase involved in cell wall biosynthesis